MSTLQNTTVLLPLLKGHMIAMKPDEIMYIKSDGPMVHILDQNNGQYAGSNPLKFYRELLEDYGFFQVSQSLLVNVYKIRLIDAVDNQIQLTCGSTLPVSRSGMKLLKAHIVKRNYKW